MVDPPTLAICLIRCVILDEESMVEKPKNVSLKNSREVIVLSVLSETSREIKSWGSRKECIAAQKFNKPPDIFAVTTRKSILGSQHSNGIDL